MKTGLDRLADLPKLRAELSDARVGLLCHPASVDRHLIHVADVLAEAGIHPAVLLGPEHGLEGRAQDMVEVPGETRQGVRVVSLYGDRFEDLSPRPEDLDGLDVVLIDLQDVGSRYYTYVWTAVLVARACAANGVRVVILDRPNPLGRVTLEGGLLEPAFRSFVGLEPLPIRHGLTLGEIVAWRAEQEDLVGLVRVVQTEGLEPGALASAWDRPFVMPSPNMPTADTALVYPGGCLLEGTNLSDGRGTTRPFEITGAPWLDGRNLARRLSALRLPGFVARPLTFEPTFHKHARRTCGGVEVHVTDPRTFRPVATYAALIALSQHAHPNDFAFRTERYEFVDDIPAFDLLTGSASARERICAGDAAGDVAEALSRVGDAERAVIEQARAAGQRAAYAG